MKARKRDAFVNLKVQLAQPMLISHRPPLWGGFPIMKIKIKIETSKNPRSLSPLHRGRVREGLHS